MLYQHKKEVELTVDVELTVSNDNDLLDLLICTSSSSDNGWQKVNTVTLS